MWEGYDKEIVKDVCYNCDSPISKQSFSYIEMMHYRLPKEKIYFERWDSAGFFFATKSKNHARLIEIAVHKEYKGKGIGKMLLFRLLSRCKNDGINRLTFRTPIQEDAIGFWTHIGATVVGLKEEDYEMELIFK